MKKIKNINDLKQDKNNANKGTALGQTMVNQSIERYGAGRSIVADKNGNIIGGNKTVKAAQEAGLEIEVVKTSGDKLIVHQREDLDLYKGEDARMLAYVDNRSSELGLDWDADVLADDIAKGLDLGDMFSEKDLNQIGVDLPASDPDEAPEAKMDAAEELQEKWKVKDGDIWEIGEHRLMCGDCVGDNDSYKLLDGNLCYACVTDPPYNVNYEGKTSDTLKIKNDNMRDNDFYNFLLSSYTTINRSLKPGSAVYVFHADSEGKNFRAAMCDSGIKLKQCCIWVKNSIVMGRQDFHWQHEPVLYGWTEGDSHRWYSDRKQSTIWNFDRKNKNTHHPTMKPVDLVSYPMKCSTQKGESVFDPFLGSGTTMIAAEQIGRICYGMEIDPKYCAVILERMSEMGLTPELVENAR